MGAKTLKQLKVLIVDDDLGARRELKSLIATYCSDISGIHECDSVQCAREYLASKQIDVVFLDIEMPKENGFALIDTIRAKKSVQIVFTTAFEKYAVQAFRVNALDYLLKPIELDELLETMTRVQTLAQLPLNSDYHKVYGESMTHLVEHIKDRSEPKFITVHHRVGFALIPIKQIIYLKAEGSYTAFHIEGQKSVLASKNLLHFEMALDDRFLRVHKSFLVNLSKIKRYDFDLGPQVTMSNDHKVDVSRRRYNQLLQAISRISIDE